MKAPLPPDAPRMAILVTAPLTIRGFYLPIIAALGAAGISVTVICSEAADLAAGLPGGARFVPINFGRVISPLRDVVSLWRLWRVLRRGRFDIVQYTTLKAALLGSVAAFLARVPVRIYAVWGLYYESRTGRARAIWRGFEQFIARFSTHVLPNSQAMAKTLARDRVAPPAKIGVLAAGSACGVDLALYDRERWRSAAAALRTAANIRTDDVVIGVFGRLTGDKGVNEIAAAFADIAARHARAILLVVGSEEDKDPLAPETTALLRTHPQVRRLPWQPELIPCIAASDIYCLASYREGLPQTALEAQALGVPVVCSDIPGNREAIADGETGWCAAPRSAAALVEPLEQLIRDEALRAAMGARGQARIAALYDATKVIDAIVQHKLALLAQRRA